MASEKRSDISNARYHARRWDAGGIPWPLVHQCYSVRWLGNEYAARDRAISD